MKKIYSLLSDKFYYFTCLLRREHIKNNKCVNRPPKTAVKKYTGTYDLPCTIEQIRRTNTCLPVCPENLSMNVMNF